MGEDDAPLSVVTARQMRSAYDVAGARAGSLLTILTLLVSLAGMAGAQGADPVLGYLIAANGASWGVGGDLGAICPFELRSPSGTVHRLAGGISLSGIYVDYYRTGGLENPGASFWRGIAGVAYLLGNAPFSWEIRARSEDQLWRISLLNERYDQLLSARFHDMISSLEGRVEVAPLVLAVELGLNAPPEPAAAARLNLGELGALGVLWRRRHLRPEADLCWRDENAHFVLRSASDETTGWLRSPHLGPFFAEFLLQRSHWRRSSQGDSQTTLEPWGDGGGHHVLLSFDAGRWIGRVGMRGWELDLRAYGMKGLYPYAKITGCRFETDGLFASMNIAFPSQGARALAEVERLEWEGNVRGHVEFWPFTSGLIDLLGLRRYFIAVSRGTIWRFHAGGASRLNERWRGEAGVNLMDIYPSANITHWRPSYLVFGRDDEQLHDLGISRLIAGAVNASVTWNVGEWEIGYSVAQVVSFKTWQRRSDEGESSQEPSEIGTVSRAYGGGFHRMSLEWRF